MNAEFQTITEYFPSISTFSQMAKHHTILINTAENYQKNSLRNRCYLTGSQGAYLLSVPLAKGKHQQKKIKDVRISYDFDWSAVHLKTIRNNYIKAPFFEHYFHSIDSLLLKKEKFLLDLNWEILHFLYKSFKLTNSIAYNLEFKDPVENGIKTSQPLPYPQIFEDRVGFVPGLSILDLLFCMGPTLKYLP